MSGTALYRALVAANSPEELAKDAAEEIDTIHSDIAQLKVMVAEIRVTNRILIGLVMVVLLFLLKLSFN